MRRFINWIIIFKYDLLSYISAIVVPLVTYYVALYFGYDEKVISTIFGMVLLLVVIHWRLNDRDFYFIPLTRTKDKNDWIGAGTFEYSRADNCFRITNAESGYIYSKCLIWSDYRLSFEFKIIKSRLGVIVRATNLSNYAMFQINEAGIRPHVRINGWWHVWESKDENLIFPSEISLDRWYKCCFSCDKGSIGIKIYNDQKEKIFDRAWELPRGSVIFSHSLSGDPGSSLGKDKQDTVVSGIPFAINLEYGSVGFRTCDYEQAFVKNVLIKKI